MPANRNSEMLLTIDLKHFTPEELKHVTIWEAFVQQLRNSKCFKKSGSAAGISAMSEARSTSSFIINKKKKKTKKTTKKRDIGGGSKRGSNCCAEHLSDNTGGVDDTR